MNDYQPPVVTRDPDEFVTSPAKEAGWVHYWNNLRLCQDEIMVIRKGVGPQILVGDGLKYVLDIFYHFLFP